jgi:hypothetical protein
MRTRTEKGTFAKEAPQTITLVGDTAVIRVERLNGDVVDVTIDSSDYALAKRFRWVVMQRAHTMHVYTEVQGSPLYLHFLLTGFEKTDHKDLDGTNNRRNNLRPCTQQQNGRNCGPKKNNKSGYKGVSFYGGKYHASISTGDKQLRLGRFSNPQDAARAYDKAAKEHFGEFAWLNFPESEAA